MKKIVLSALAVASMAGIANAQSIEFQIVERFNDAAIDAGDGPATAAATTVGGNADKTLWFVVLARATGLNAPTTDTLTGIGGFAGTIVQTSSIGVGGTTGGSYKATGAAGTGGNPTNNSPVNFFPAPSSNPSLGTAGVALYNPFRLVADLGAGGNGTRLAPNAEK